MINVWENTDPRDEAANFVAVWDIGATVLLDGTGEYAALLGIRGVPTNVLVDEHGIVRVVGGTTPDELDAAVAELLDGDGG
ncbi:hypothetical protein GCM10010508_49900 [Streptomyces naganishii JCM 4654]|uniref:Uncharacterized protein n=1 Tax=Streptomyces naganishii JCM 4654 TaxID=1306179 RepID=A0A918Y7Z2_9ACTN|nr:hypothetical protein GCM10010508_49900 [Streptomyces naganishii JCM 4654]